jgi:hypothetical protein
MAQQSLMSPLFSPEDRIRHNIRNVISDNGSNFHNPSDSVIHHRQNPLAFVILFIMKIFNAYPFSTFIVFCSTPIKIYDLEFACQRNITLY